MIEKKLNRYTEPVRKYWVILGAVSGKFRKPLAPKSQFKLQSACFEKLIF